MTSIDLKLLRQLESLSGPGASDLVPKVVGLVLGVISESKVAIASAYAAGDLRNVQRSAHRLKSSVGNVGAARLIELLDALEKLVSLEPVSASGELLREVKAECDRVRESLERTLRERESA